MKLPFQKTKKSKREGKIASTLWMDRDLRIRLAILAKSNEVFMHQLIDKFIRDGLERITKEDLEKLRK